MQSLYFVVEMDIKCERMILIELILKMLSDKKKMSLILDNYVELFIN